MKKIIFIMLLLAVSVFAQQNMSGNISQPVAGSFLLDNNFLNCITQDRQVLFGPTGEAAIQDDECFRSDFFELNGILTNCDGDNCDLVTTLETELQDANPSVGEEIAMRDDMLAELSTSTDCLINVYNGSIVNTSDPSDDILVGAHLYFNTVKPCFVRTITALGALEQIYIDETNSSFFVQKLQALEEQYQHFLALEDLQATRAFNISHATLNGSVEGAGGAGAQGAQPDALELEIAPTAGGDVTNLQTDVTIPTGETSFFNTVLITETMFVDATGVGVAPAFVNIAGDNTLLSLTSRVVGTA
ncbi:Uncharacterised protein [uncultured archaeon]|nr:Uncharacterised protein [uncultured archaeon]